MQLIDDALDFSSSTAQLGKPGFANIRLGLATGPALYAAEEYPELNGMIGRHFNGDGDVESVNFTFSNLHFDYR
jgi:hexaprenyl-diphosphate synthase